MRTQAANASKCRRRRRDKRLPPLVVRAPADIALHQSLISLPLDQPGLLLLEGGKVLQDGDVADSYYLIGPVLQRMVVSTIHFKKSSAGVTLTALEVVI